MKQQKKSDEVKLINKILEFENKLAEIIENGSRREDQKKAIEKLAFLDSLLDDYCQPLNKS